MRATAASSPPASRTRKACWKINRISPPGHTKRYFTWPSGTGSRTCRCPTCPSSISCISASESRIRGSTTICRSNARRGAIRASAAAPEMEAYLLDWLNLIVRWAHIVVAIAWIGASFYFIWLDDKLEPARDGEFAGELYAIHGGGFYRAQKYRLA